jgi:hypothetical protein
MPSRSGPPTTAGRWSLLPAREPDPTLRNHATAEVLLERHGVLTRGAVMAEQVKGGFGAAYRVLAAFEDAGRVRRGYFVEGLGASQFATTGAVDRLRAGARPLGESPDGGPGRTVVLAAADPANPYGAALGWPERPADGGATGHRPGRKAGALVVLVDGELVLYVERGGRSLLSWTQAGATLQSAADALALAVREGALGRLTVERADGETSCPPTTRSPPPWPRPASTPPPAACASAPDPPRLRDPGSPRAARAPPLTVTKEPVHAPRVHGFLDHGVAGSGVSGCRRPGSSSGASGRPRRARSRSP